jgi:hypothetical protein
MRDSCLFHPVYTALHLWASVKQGPNIDPPEHTSSADARAWYETPDAAVPTCDGDSHVLRYTIYRENAAARGALSGWVKVKTPHHRHVHHG